MAAPRRREHAARVTTATQTAGYLRFPSAADPSGAELRKALLLPPKTASRAEPALFLAGASALTLLAGVLRVVTA